MKFNFKYETTNFDFGGERYLRTGEVLPDSAIEELKGFDAILLGAIGHPDVPPESLKREFSLRPALTLISTSTLDLSVSILVWTHL
jgi:3-isopropylmalate dehydrogenase